MGVKGRLRSGSRLRFERLEARRVLATYFVDETIDFAGGLCAPDDAMGNSGCNIRSAIEAATANPGPDTILIPAGTYPNDLGPLLIADGSDANDLSIAVDPASPGTVLIRNNSGFERVFEITAASTTIVSLDGLSIEDGFANDGLGGGGIFSTADLRITNTTFIGNQVDGSASPDTGAGGNDGGAIQAFGPLSISDSAFSSNSAAGSGGAIDFTPNVVGAALTISNTDFLSNTAVVDGGALHVGTASAAGATVSITGGLFEVNSAGISGGGAYVANAGLSVSGASFDSNLADFVGSFGGSGGGLYFQSNDGSHAFGLTGGGFDSNVAAGSGGGANFVNANGTISGTTFQLNSANMGGPGSQTLTVGGGGFASTATTIVPTITASNLLVDQNTATFGGGIALVATNLTIDNSTLSANDATNSIEGGGGIGAFGLVATPATLDIQNSTISGNTTAGLGGGVLAIDMNVTSSSNFSSNTASVDGGGIYVDATDNGFAVSLTGGTFDSNVSGDSGGGVLVANAELSVSGVSFSSNRASVVDGAGGGLYFFTADGLETFTITGGDFTSNQAGGGGGGASFENADGTISGTSFSLNTATLGGSPAPFENGGGGISSTAINRVPSITASGITVDQNSAASGGGIGLVGTNFTLTGSTISNNNSSNSLEGGAGIGAVGSILGSALLEIGGTSTIIGNTAQGEGGGIGAIDMDLTIQNSQISSNTASSGRGGGIGILGSLIEPTINIDTVVVDGNSAFSRGGGIYVGSDTLGSGFNPTVTVLNTTISNNSVVDSSAGLAGGLFAPGQLAISDSFIRSNNAATAAGLYFGTGLNANSGSLNVTNTEISMNNALLSGGGVVIEPAVGVGPTATFTNSRILQNRATEQGGGLLSSGMPLVFSGGVVSGNSTNGGIESDGGAFSVDGDLTINGTSFQANTARDFGGAIFYGGGTLSVVGATFDANIANDGGGAFYMQSDLATNATFDNSAFTNNRADSSSPLGNGGAIEAVSSSVMNLNVIGGSSFTGNVANNSGGAISGVFDSLTIQGSSFNSNSAPFSGGGAISARGATSISGSEFIGNSTTGGGGGALILFDSPLTVDSTLFDSNTALSQGGAVYLDAASIPTTAAFNLSVFRANSAAAGGAIAALGMTNLMVETSSFDGNSAVQFGGAINSENSLSIGQSTFTQNTITGGFGIRAGGAVYLSGAGSVENSTFSGNDATDLGGAIAVEGTGIADIRHTTITLNNAGSAGGVSVGASAAANVGNSIIAANTALGADPDVAGVFNSLDGNLIGDVGSASGFIGALDQVGNSGSPIDPLLGPLMLQDPADLTQTHALLPGSPAIDRAASGVSLAIDQRGTTRPQDGDGNRVFVADVGAFEAATLILLDVGDLVFADLDNNGLLDGNDFGIADVVLELYEDTDGSGDLDIATDTFVTSTLSLGDGSYSFQLIPPGEYIIVISESNYLLPGSPLEAYRTSTGNDPAPDPDNDINGDDNGTEISGLGVVSGAFTLTVDGEPTNDGDTNPNTNLSIDFGFAPTLQVNSDSDSVFLGEFVDFDVLLNDFTTVSGGVLLVSFTQPSLGLGTVTLNADNTLRFTTDPLVGTGSDSFTYTATDGTSTLTTSVFVDVQDNPSDRPADAVDDNVFTDEDTPLVFDGTIAILTSNDVPEIFAGSSQPLLISSVDPIDGVTQGTVTLNGQIATYTPPADFFGTDQFTYSLVGGDAPATVFVDVAPINDPPIAVSDSFNVFELSGANNLDVLANDLAGPANESDQLLTVFEILTPPTLGTAVISPLGDSILYTPTGSPGLDSFEYTIRDSQGLSSGPTLVSIEVLQSIPANAIDDSVSTDEDASLNILASELLSNDTPGTGVFGGPPSIISVDIIDGITVGTVTLNADNSIDYVPPADFFGTDQFTYSISGGSSQATVSVEVFAVNDLPTVTSDFFSLSDPSGPVSLDVLQNDRPGPDNELDQTLQVFEITTLPTLGTATISSTGDSIIYTAFGSSGIDSFAYRIIDSEGGISTSGLVDIDLSFSLPPVANDDVATTNEDTALTLPSTILLANDVPGSGAISGALDIESVDVISGVTLGTVTLNGDDSITYVPPTNFFGTDRFTYSLVSGLAPATVVVTVNAVNDPPIANDDTFQIIGSGNRATLNVLNNDLPGPSNESGQTIRVISIISPPSLGTAVISASGASISYLTSEALGSDSFVYEITDSEGLTSQATATILIDSTLQITGLLTCDLNGNLAHDANEALVNREVFLDLNGNRVFDDGETLVTTDSNGRYRFPLAASGNYEVVTMIPTGCTTITPFPSTVRTAGVGNLARSLAVANLDGDADLDLVVVSDLDGRITELHNQDGQLTVTPRFTIGGRPQSIAVWQSENGSIPATTAVADSGTTADGGRILRIGPDQAIIPVPGGPFKVLLEDFDGDNKPEIIFSDYRNSSLRMIRGGTTEIIDLTAETGANVISAAFGDFDADGDIDIAVAGDQFSASGTGGVRLLMGDGNGGFTLSEAIGFAGGVVDIATADLDQTAGDEILVLSSSGMLRTLSFDGTVLRQVSATPIEAGAASFVVGDFNGDNFQDVAIASTVKRSSGNENGSTIVEGKLEFLVGTTSGTFVPFATTFSVDSPSDMVTVDLDGDGIDELAVTNLFQEVSGPRGPQFVFPSTVTVFKLNVAVLPVTVLPGQLAEADFVFASADPDLLLDVNRDNQLAPVDALIVMNALNRAGEGEASGYRPRYDTDVNRDGRTSPVDALIIINRLNRMASANGEGEANTMPVNDLVGAMQWTDEAEKRRREQRASAVDELWASEFDLFD